MRKELKQGPIQIAVLLLVYFLGRLVFQQFPELKILFIYPTGLLVDLFYNFGYFTGSEWIFGINQTRFVIDASCSGTTFFSLLGAYFAFRILTHKIPLFWLASLLPIVLIANSMRVLSSIYAHELGAFFNMQQHSDIIHVATGSITFALVFLIIALFIEKPKGILQHAA